jgi:hypothetical protein
LSNSTPQRVASFVASLLTTCLFASGVAAELPNEGDCPPLGGRPGASGVEDAAPTVIREGMMLSYSDLVLLRELIPVEVWRHRNIFFFDGMRMELGACHRRYPISKEYAEATEQFSSQVGVDEDGNLWGYVAGVPFPPDSIDDGSPDAGVKWAWNVEHRYRGAGPHGKFRITDMPSRIGGIQVYTGNFFHLRTRHRADLVDSEFAVPGSEENLWIGGGRFDTPFDARHLAWRQMRPVNTERNYKQTDSTFVYVPTMRKVRRAATAWVDGMYTPRYRVGGDHGGGSLAVGSNGQTPTGSISPTSALSAAITEHLPSGFTDFAMRPNAYHWRILGQREVLAPINATRSGYPYDPERNFGSMGLSVGSDRWEVRLAVVLEGSAKTKNEGFQFVQLYVDYQTQMPLYIITRRNRGLLVDIGIPVHRFSGDIIDYPIWPGDDRALVFDPVAAVFFHVADGGSGWRREAYDIRSVPPEERSMRRMVSTDYLLRGH